jgi:hypothetical protein
MLLELHNIKSDENPSSGSRVVSGVKTDGENLIGVPQGLKFA